jgi:hypothetical protein
MVYRTNRFRDASHSDGYPRPRPQPVSLIPDQNVDLPLPFSDRGVPPDIRQMAREREALARGTRPFREEIFERREIVPGGIRMVNLSQRIVAANVAQLGISQNYKRKRFLISVSDTALSTVYFYFFNQPNGPIPVQPGGTWDESGSTVSTDEIWIMCATPGQNVTLYEGVSDDKPRPHR